MNALTIRIIALVVIIQIHLDTYNHMIAYALILILIIELKILFAIFMIILGLFS